MNETCLSSMNKKVDLISACHPLKKNILARGMSILYNGFTSIENARLAGRNRAAPLPHSFRKSPEYHE